MKVDENYFKQNHGFEFTKENESINKSKSDGEKAEYLRIWNSNPSYKDVNTSNLKVKFIFLVILFAFIIINISFITQNYIIGLLISIILFFLFLLAFNDHFFNLQNLFSKYIRNIAEVNPFRDIRFWQLTEDSRILDSDPYSIYFSNVKELLHTGIRVFQIQTIPSNVHPAINLFVKTLSENSIPFTYQVIHSPILNPEKKNEITPKDAMRSANSYHILIFFYIFYYAKGKLTDKKISILKDQLEKYSEIMKVNFISNFAHFKVNLLSSKAAVRALRICVLKTEQEYKIKKDNSIYGKDNNTSLIIKVFFIVFILGLLTFCLISLNLQMLVIILINSLIILFFIFFFDKTIINQLFDLRSLKSQNISYISPFSDLKFYCLRNIPDSIFIHTKEGMLIASKSFNLRQISHPIYINQSKFFRPIINQKIPFIYTALSTPISSRSFDKEGLNNLNAKAKYFYLSQKTPEERKNWLSVRNGIWRLIFSISVSAYTFTSHIKNIQIAELEKKIKKYANILIFTFSRYHSRFYVEPLKREKLMSDFLLNTLKNRFYLGSGTHLNYLLIQGKNIGQLISINDEFKKGIETKVAAEFNVPTSLINSILIGSTINTEVLEEETPAGFTDQQLHSLLIANGTPQEREDLSLKIESELIKSNIPSIIFDFTGRSTKLVSYFENTFYEKEILYFKLGSAFNIKLFDSEIPNDENNIDYLDYMFEVWAIVKKKNDEYMQMLKNSLLRIPEMELSNLDAVLLDFQNKDYWEKNPITESLVSMLREFSQDSISFSGPHKENDLIGLLDFIRDDKTIIIDLSIQRNDVKKQLFSAFVILSKIIHYCNTFEDYCKKIIMIPNVDFFFDEWYLEKNVNYDKLNKFLDPLFEKGFGLIFSVNQTRSIHSNVFNYFKNIITFRTIHKADIAILKNIMNLQGYEGKGIYGANRHNVFHIDYLMNLKSDVVIVKRADIEQPFPVKIDWKAIKNTEELEYSDIIEFMGEQGYDLEFTEKQILDKAKKTLFEKDFGTYYYFIDEIKTFLQHLKTVDQIGNLYETTIKEELANALNSKIRQRTKNRKKIKQIRERIFDILVKHGYLVENNAKTAGGSESIRTTYKVGEKYEKAIDDLFNVQNIKTAKIKIDDLLKEQVKPTNELDEIIKEEQFKEILLDITVKHLLYNLSKISSSISKGEFQEAITIGSKLLDEFLVKLGSKHLEHTTEGELTEKNIVISTNYLTENKKIPYSQEEILEFRREISSDQLEGKNVNEKANNLYKKIWEFYIGIQDYINKFTTSEELIKEM